MVRCGVASVSLSCSHRSPPCPLASTWRILKEPSRRILSPFAYGDKHMGCEPAIPMRQPPLFRVSLSPAEEFRICAHAGKMVYSLSATNFVANK